MASVRLPVVSLTLLAVSAVQPITASQRDSVTLPIIVVTALRADGTSGAHPGTTTVISRDEIESRHPASMIDLLRQVPGLHIDQAGGRGSVSSVYLRGADPNFVVVMIDGIAVNDPTNNRGGSFDFSALDVDGVERVEILRGPLSSFYGADAMAGAINIITQSSVDTPRIKLHGGAGGHGSQRAGVHAGGRLGSGFYGFNAAYVDAGRPIEGNRFIGKNINANIDLNPSNATGLRLVTRYSENDGTSFPDDSGGPRLAVRRDVDTRDARDLSIGMDLEHMLSTNTRYNVKISYYDREERTDSPGVEPGLRDPAGIPPNRSNNTLHRTTLFASGRVDLSESSHILFGIDSRHEEGLSDGAVDFGGFVVPSRFELDRSQSALFVEGRYDINSFTVHGGLRADFPDNYNSEINPRLGLLTRGRPDGPVFKANWAKGFKLPSLFALGNPLVGNPALRPETSESVDIGVSEVLLGERVRGGATLFHNRFNDLVDLDEGPPPRLVNRSEVTTKGLELTIDALLTNTVSARAHLTYTETDIKGTDEDLRNRPKWRAGLDLRWRKGKDWTLHAAALYVGKSLDSAVPTGDVFLDDYTRIDVTATWAPTNNRQVVFAVDNLFNSSYEEAVGFPAPGITPRVVFQAQF